VPTVEWWDQRILPKTTRESYEANHAPTTSAEATSSVVKTEPSQAGDGEESVRMVDEEQGDEPVVIHETEPKHANANANGNGVTIKRKYLFLKKYLFLVCSGLVGSEIE
jgi:hypothetical protein